MRIAVMVLSLCFMMPLGCQSCLLAGAGGIADDHEMSGSGSIGILLALFFLFGGAFALGHPKVSRALFIIGAAIGLFVGFNTEFTDLMMWGGLAAGLAVMAHFGVREKARLST